VSRRSAVRTSYHAPLFFKKPTIRYLSGIANHKDKIMNPIFAAYASLAAAIVCEVTGTSLLQKSEQFSKPFPTLGMAVCFIASFFLLSMALKAIPLGIAYAIWAGLGIILTSIISVVVFRFTLDGWAMLGMALIISGVLVMSLLSNNAAH
jgi:small multidrug resistance pump